MPGLPQSVPTSVMPKGVEHDTALAGSYKDLMCRPL